MSMDGGYPRAVTFTVPDMIPDGLIGDFISNEVQEYLNAANSGQIARRSVSLSFMSPRLALLRFETHIPLTLQPQVREFFNAAKAAFISAAAQEQSPEPSASDSLSTAALNRKKQNKVA